MGQGYVCMPNMSRKSLDRHVERVHKMIQNNPEQESFLRHRFQLPSKSFKLFSRSLLNYDSGDEVDVSQFDRRYSRTTVHRESVVRRTFVRVWTFLVSVFTFSAFRRRTSVTRQQFQAQYGTPRVSLWSRVKTVVQRSGTWSKELLLTVFRKFYLFVATVLYWDTLLLRIRRPVMTEAEKGAGDASTVTAEEALEERMPRNKKRFLWILAALLPLLLLAGELKILFGLFFFFCFHSGAEEAQHLRSSHCDRGDITFLGGEKSSCSLLIVSAVGRNSLAGFWARNGGVDVDTTRVREFLVATEKEAWHRVAVAKEGLEAMRLDTVAFVGRNYDAAQARTEQWIGQAKQLWTESSEKVVATAKELWRKQRG